MHIPGTAQRRGRAIRNSLKPAFRNRVVPVTLGLLLVLSLAFLGFNNHSAGEIFSSLYHTHGRALASRRVAVHLEVQLEGGEGVPGPAPLAVPLQPSDSSEPAPVPSSGVSAPSLIAVFSPTPDDAASEEHPVDPAAPSPPASASDSVQAVQELVRFLNNTPGNLDQTLEDLDLDQAGSMRQGGEPLGPTLPRVALLFLTRGPMPHEPTWRLFLRQARRLTAGWNVSHGDQSHAAGGQQLFSVYMHAAPHHRYPRDSVFHNMQIRNPVKVHWGQHSMVEAERRLLAAALADPLNQRFALLSETCIPLYPPGLVWLQLLAERRSRINACAAVNLEDAKRRMTWRWVPGMHSGNLTIHAWRKSSQWFALNREHAAAVAGDTEVVAAFARECWAEVSSVRAQRRQCISDEHYIPTLLASRGLEGETQCRGELTHTAWLAGHQHPVTWWTPESVSIQQIEENIRAPWWARPGECRPAAAIAAAAAVWRLQHARHTLPAAEPTSDVGGAAFAQRRLLQRSWVGAAAELLGRLVRGTMVQPAAADMVGQQQQQQQQQQQHLGSGGRGFGRRLRQAGRKKWKKRLTGSAKHRAAVARLAALPRQAVAVPQAAAQAVVPQVASQAAAAAHRQQLLRDAAAKRRGAVAAQLKSMQQGPYIGISIHYAPNHTQPVKMEDLGSWLADFEGLVPVCPLLSRKYEASTAAKVAQIYREYLSRPW